MSGIQKVRLNNLNINLTNALIVGIVIAKSSPRIIGSKKKNGDSRGVTSFTLRDSEIDTVNCDVWGSEYFIITFYERFLVGDVGMTKHFYDTPTLQFLDKYLHIVIIFNHNSMFF